MIRNLIRFWEEKPATAEPVRKKQRQGNLSPLREESKRLDEELERKAKGKEAELEVYGYTRRVKDIGDS